MNTALWIVQWMLAVLFLAHGVLYLVPPQELRKTMERMPFSLGFLQFVGVAEAPKPRGRSPGRPKGSRSGRARRYPVLKKAA